MNFKHWLHTEEAQPIQPAQVQQILSAHRGPLNTGNIRTDLLVSAANRGEHIMFDQDFPITNIGRRIQGYDMNHVMTMINTIFKTIGLPAIQDRTQIQPQTIQPHIEQIKEALPPLIVSLMPDESYHLDDGNHRLGVARTLGLQTVKAFIIQ